MPKVFVLCRPRLQYICLSRSPSLAGGTGIGILTDKDWDLRPEKGKTIKYPTVQRNRPLTPASGYNRRLAITLIWALKSPPTPSYCIFVLVFHLFAF
jgi:hypothetical protein